MLTILLMIIKIRDYDDNDDNKNDDDDGEEGDRSFTGASYSCSASGFGWSFGRSALFHIFRGQPWSR